MRTFVFLTGLTFSILLAIAQPNKLGLPIKERNAVEIVCSLQDEEGFWWYGGKGTGLCRFDGFETESFCSNRQNPNLLRSNDVLCITEQRNNAEIWFGTKEGAYILHKKDYTVSPIVVKTQQDSNELVDKRISCLITEADGSIWLSYRNQLLHFSSKAELLERFETKWEGKNRSVLSVCFDADSTLWAGLWNGGVLCLKMVNGRRLVFNGQWSDYPVSPPKYRTAEETEKMLDSVMSKQAPGNDSIVLSWAKACIPRGTEEGSYFIGTYHSLYLYDGQQVTQLLTGLDKVRSMVFSNRLQSLFLSSKRYGICRWKDKKLRVLVDSIQSRRLQLQGDTALLLSRGLANVSLLNLRTLKLMQDTTTVDVRPVVTAYAIDGNKQLMPFRQEVLTLPKGIDFVELYLSTLEFDHASQVQFAYRLSEDEEWTELPEGEHVVKFAHLPYGKTQLQIRGTDTYGRWSAPVTVLTLVRPASWYEYTWLWISFIIIFFACSYCLYKKGRRMSQQEGTEEESNKLSVADREFLDKAVAAVSAHMLDADYSVDTLASDLCMSRANLHRRMRVVTRQTPTDFIRNQRLERAAQLLRTTSYSINEIADLVGFSYASYFSKCFKDKYGVLPKDY